MKITRLYRLTTSLLITGMVFTSAGCGADDQGNSADAPFERPRNVTDSQSRDVAILEVNGDAGMPDTTQPASNPPATQECAVNPPTMTSVSSCAEWTCERVDYPECWSCTNTPVAFGSPCVTPQGEPGECEAQTCTPTTQSNTGDNNNNNNNDGNPSDNANDPGVDFAARGPNQFEVASIELSLGTWTSNPTQTLTLYTPNDTVEAPVVILHHGFNLSANDYASYGAHLASWGFVVVMPNTTTGLFGGPTQRDMADILTAIVDWIDGSAADAAHPLHNLVDLEGFVFAGHSLGGKLSFLVASESTRVRGIFGIDPVDTAGGPGAMPSPTAPSVTPELMPQIEVPFVVVGETTNATSVFGPACAPAEENFAQYYAASASPALKIEILGANHMSFLDNPNCGLSCFACPTGTDNPANTRRLTQKYLTAFSQMILKGNEMARGALVGAQMEADVISNFVTYSTSGGF